MIWSWCATRREVLRLGLLGATLGPASPGQALPDERIIAFRNLHTGEFVEVVYWARGGFDADGLRRIAWVLRDHRTDEMHEIDRRLLDVLVALRTRLGTREPFDVISGYRSPATNTWLRRVTTGVARDSLHRLGQAIDVRLPDQPLPAVREAAESLRVGGVGYYPRSEFVHVDVGRVRRWELG